MSYYYPQACLKLRVLPEDFKLISDASLQRPYEFSIVPRSITYSQNDHKTANSFSAEIDYKSFPFDPRSIRYCGVVIYMQDLGKLYDDKGALQKISPGAPTRVDAGVTNAVFSGFVDEENITFDDSKRTVHFEGRDFTALLIDQKYMENTPIALNEPIDTAITRFVAQFKATQQLKIVNKTGGTLPTLAQYYPDFGSPLAGQKNPGVHESYWDIIQDIVHRAGLICYVRLDQIIITSPRNLYNPSSDLKFIYGINVKNLSMKRKLGRYKNFNVLVRSRVGKEVLTAKIPEEATPDWCASFGITREPQNVPVLKPDGSLDSSQIHTAPYIAFPIPNIGSKDALIRIGQTVFEDYSRQQLEGSFDTSEMLGHAGVDQSDPNFKVFDLTQLQIGQNIALELAVDDISAISRIKSIEERTQYLIRKNYSPAVASVFAKTMGKFSPRFFVKSINMTINQDEGFKLKIDFINIIELSYRSLS